MPTRSEAEKFNLQLTKPKVNPDELTEEEAKAAADEKQRKIELDYYIADWKAAQLEASAKHAAAVAASLANQGPKPKDFDMFAVQPKHIPGVSKWSKDHLRGGRRRRRHTRRGPKHRSTRRR